MYEYNFDICVVYLLFGSCTSILIVDLNMILFSIKSVFVFLYSSGAFVNATNNRGDTALHIAAYRGHVDIIMTLLRAKADVNLRNEKGKTPQQEALEGGHQHIAENIVNFSKGIFYKTSALCHNICA